MHPTRPERIPATRRASIHSLDIGCMSEEYVPQEENEAPRHSGALSGAQTAWMGPAASEACDLGGILCRQSNCERI